MSIVPAADTRTTGLRLLVLLALVAGLLSTSTLAAEAVTRPATLYHERPVTAGPIEPGFPIDHVGVVFDLPPGEDAHHDHEGEVHEGADGLAVRFRTGGVWGPWQEMIEDGAQAVGQWTGALVAAGDADAYQVRGLPSFARSARAAALNTTDGPREVVGHRPVGAAQAVTTCKSRLDWGADETIRTSTRSYAPVQVLTVHHTATQNDDPDPDARVRAIYEYHVKTNGWDDIGYQALISEDGTVYEGRWSGSNSPSCVSGGGTGWEFGHAGTAADAEMVTAAHTAGYNTGNFGVALLGTLSNVAPQAAARSALVEYLAEIAKRHGIDAESRVDYVNSANAKTVAAISGHRDFTATDCPGSGLYDDLPNIRTEVAAAMSQPEDTTSTDGGTTDGGTTDSGTTDSGSEAMDVASAEQLVIGTVSGNYADTWGDDGVVQSITEVETGGKPSSRSSYLEHVWTVPVTGGSTVTLVIDATASTSNDGDDFVFEYSLDGGNSYLQALLVPAGGSGTFSSALDPGTSGTVHVRVRDNDRASGARSLDRITVDHLAILSASSPASDEPAPQDPEATTSPIELATVGSKVKGAHHVDLSWSDATSVRVYRDGSAVADVTGTSWTDAIGGKGSGTYVHRVCALDSTGAVTDACSEPVSTTVG